jgi:hypothetical protein
MTSQVQSEDGGESPAALAPRRLGERLEFYRAVDPRVDRRTAFTPLARHPCSVHGSTKGVDLTI